MLLIMSFTGHKMSAVVVQDVSWSANVYLQYKYYIFQFHAALVSPRTNYLFSDT